MAGGSHPKSSASHRKSRWESASSTTITTTTNNNNNKSSSDPKLSKLPSSSSSNPSPKLRTGPSPKPPTTNNAGTTPPFLPFPDLGPPPPPAYGFHMLERRTIVLADGSVRSYFALPPDYKDFPPCPPSHPLPSRFMPGGPEFPAGAGLRLPPMSPEGLGLRESNLNQNPMKRKYGVSEEEFKYRSNPNGIYRSDYAGTSSPFRKDVGGEFRAGKYMRTGGGDSVGAITKHLEVDQIKLKKAFLYFVKVINESETDRKQYLEDGKRGCLQCVACGRSSKDFSDMHALIMHTYNSENADLRIDHLGLHKALCVLMGWNYLKPPDNSKAYQFLPADEAAANQDDLIMWPPTVIIHNTITGKGKNGRIEGWGNKAMDGKIRDLGFPSGKSKSLYGREGHQGVTLITFSGDQSGLKEALRLAEHFEKENHGRKAWEHIQPITLGKDDEKNPDLVKVVRSGEKTRILYGYLGTATDLSKLGFETRKKVMIESLREFKGSK